MERKSSFPPVIGANTRVLILGSLPGEASLKAQRYYAHARNQFWRLTGAVIGRDITSLDYAERLEVLLHAGIGLWDVVASARRSGSLDAALRAVEENALAELVSALPRLRAVGFNGGTAARIGRRSLAGGSLALLDLPSSSAAYTLPFTAKRERWLQLGAYLR